MSLAFKEDDVDALEFGVDNATCSVSYDDEGRPVLIKYSTGVTEFRTYLPIFGYRATLFDKDDNFIEEVGKE